jgi:hypothetical protein
MPDYTFNFTFTGLCCFVPKYDIHKKPQNNQMRVLMVDAREPDMKDPYSPMEAHEPVLIVPHGDVVTGDESRYPDIVTFEGKDPKNAIFFLGDQDIAIRDAASKSLTVTASKKGERGCPSQASQFDFDWVAPLTKISPGRGKVSSACFHTRDQVVHKHVGCRMALCDGKIKTYGLATNDRDKVIAWKFKERDDDDPPSDFSQALADLVSYEFIGKSATLILDISSLRNPQSDRLKAILKDPKPIMLTNQYDHYFQIANMPLPDAMEITPHPGTRNRDYHFVAFYHLTPQNGSDNIPYSPVSPTICKGPLSSQPNLLNPHCPPAQAVADEAA